MTTLVILLLLLWAAMYTLDRVLEALPGPRMPLDDVEWVYKDRCSSCDVTLFGVYHITPDDRMVCVVCQDNMEV